MTEFAKLKDSLLEHLLVLGFLSLGLLSVTAMVMMHVVAPIGVICQTNPFECADKRGQHLLITPPYDQIATALWHYSACKAKALESTSACIILPALRRA
jgi:hypothetical protein